MSYHTNQDLRYRNKTPVKITCDFCSVHFELIYKSAEKNRKKYDGHKCSTCTGWVPKPQNSPSYWTEERKQNQSSVVLQSESYKEAIELRGDLSGENNPMFGKKMSIETKQRMSQSRTGKIGTQATAWKGGKSSINQRVKGLIHGRHNWYGKVYQRDGWKCVKCGGKGKIDAHHIEPVSKIIKRLCENKIFENDDEKVGWLAEHPDLVDSGLKNGITLCRKCHKEAHKNWGSHESRSR